MRSFPQVSFKGPRPNGPQRYGDNFFVAISFHDQASYLHFTMPLFQLNVIWRLHRLLVICEGRTSSHHFRYQGLRTVHNPYI